MKKIVLISMSLLVLVSCKTKPKEESEEVSNDSIPRTTILFEEPNFNFGQITQGETVEHIFFFTNTGDNDLKIETVQASCGCTTPNYTDEVVKPGQKSKISVKFNSAGREGNQSKTVNIYANTDPEKTQVHFTAQVVLPKNK
jgi:hypothetical protein